MINSYILKQGKPISFCGFNKKVNGIKAQRGSLVRIKTAIAIFEWKIKDKG